MQLIIGLIIGGVVGWLASIVMKTNAQMGLIANVLVGVVGSALGYWIASLLDVTVAGGIIQWLIAIGGAVVLILILKALRILK